MPFSPSRKVMALKVEAVFMKAGSSVTRPVFARRLEMSMPRSLSVPSTTSSSSSCLLMTRRTFSGTGSLLRQAGCAHALSRAGGQQSSAQAPEELPQLCRRMAEIICRGERRTFSEPPRHGAHTHACCPAGGQIDRAVADQKRARGRDAQGGADAQEAVRRGFSRRLVSADHRLERVRDAQTAEDLAGELARL